MEEFIFLTHCILLILILQKLCVSVTVFFNSPRITPYCKLYLLIIISPITSLQFIIMEIEEFEGEQQQDKFGSGIPSVFLNKIIESKVPKNLKIGKSFKDNLKLQIEVFIHYLLTISDEICIEKGSKFISIGQIKEALYEIDHDTIHQ